MHILTHLSCLGRRQNSLRNGERPHTEHTLPKKGELLNTNTTFDSTSSSGNSSKMKESRLFNKLSHIYDSQTLLYLNSSKINTQCGTEWSQSYLFGWTVVNRGDGDLYIVKHVKLASHWHKWIFYLRGFWMWWVLLFIMDSDILKYEEVSATGNFISVYVSIFPLRWQVHIWPAVQKSFILRC